MLNLELTWVRFWVPELKKLCPCMVLKLLHILMSFQERFHQAVENALRLRYAFAVQEYGTNNWLKNVSKYFQWVFVERFTDKVSEFLITQFFCFSHRLFRLFYHYLVSWLNTCLIQDADDYFNILVKLFLELLRVLVVENVFVDPSLDKDKREEDIVYNWGLKLVQLLWLEILRMVLWIRKIVLCNQKVQDRVTKKL